MVLSSTYSTPLTCCYSRDALEKMAALVDELAMMVHAFCSSTAVLEVISQQHTTQNTNTTTVKVTTTIIPNESNDHTDNTKTNHTKTTTDVVNETPSRFNDIKSPLKSSPVITSLAPVSSTHMIKCLSPMEMFVKNLLNYFAGHRCKPPAFVFLRTELKPPWEPHDPRGTNPNLTDVGHSTVWEAQDGFNIHFAEALSTVFSMVISTPASDYTTKSSAAWNMRWSGSLKEIERLDSGSTQYDESSPGKIRCYIHAAAYTSDIPSIGIRAWLIQTLNIVDPNLWKVLDQLGWFNWAVWAITIAFCFVSHQLVSFGLISAYAYSTRTKNKSKSWSKGLDFSPLQTYSRSRKRFGMVVGESSQPPVKDTTLTFQCPILTSTNYTIWRMRMEVLLGIHGVCDVVDPGSGDAKKNNIVKGLLFQSIPEDLILQIENLKSGKEMWEAIKTRNLGADRVKEARL
ncbi:hypothetical protein Tco_0651859 [Tanacetum coccineum]|uniref:Retrotransposon Copia-like N-terminal domain-containing protein n=1 Tax=Tanacetum coccineum TaxID=301880 RepID=A0ABQ4WW57_9ASTR